MGCNGNKYYNVTFSRSIGSEQQERTIQIVLDDIPCGSSESTIQEMAIDSALTTIKFDDDQIYGAPWTFKSISETL